MTSAMTALGMALGGTSLICYLLMTRLQLATTAVAQATNAARAADNERHFDLPQSSFLDSF